MAITNNDECCSTIYPAECVQFTGTTNLVATKNEYLDAIIDKLGEYAVDWTTTYDITCLGGTETAASYTETISAILAEVCTATTPTFDATCVGGTTTNTPNEAIAFLLTYVCSVVTPSFDTTCIGGSTGTSLSDTVDAILTSICTTPVYDGLTYTCLTAPTDNNLDTILQALITGIEANQVDYNTDDFTTTANTCGITLAINEAGLVTKLTTNTTFLTAVNTYVQENITYRTFANDTCARNFLADSFVFESPLQAEKACYSLYTYRLDVTDLTLADSTFEGITLPSGVYYPSGGLSISDTAAIEAWFASELDISTVTVSNVATGLTVTFRIILTTHGDTSTVIPYVHTKASSGMPEVKTVVAESVLNSATDICCSLKVSTTETVEEGEDPCLPEIVGHTGVCVDRLQLTKSSWSVTYSFSEGAYVDLALHRFVSVKILNQVYPLNGGSPVLLIDTADVANALNNLGVGTFTVVLVESPTLTWSYTITYEGYIDTAYSDFYPEYIFSRDGVEVTYESDLISVDTADTCERYVAYSCADDWEDVSYETDFSGDIQYRRIGSTIEVKGGTLTYSGLTGNTAITTIDTNAFSTSYTPITASSMNVGSNHTEDEGYGTTSNFNGADWRPNTSFISNDATTSSFKAFFSRITAAFTSEAINSTATSTVSIDFIIPSFTYYIA